MAPGKSHKKGAGANGRASHSKTGGGRRPRDGPIEWTPRMTMNMLDLSRDDDFINHLLVEKLGTGHVPLYVHKMDPTRTLPKTDPKDLMGITQRVSFSFLCGVGERWIVVLTRFWICFARVFFSGQLITAKGPVHKAIKQAVDELLKYVLPIQLLDATVLF